MAESLKNRTVKGTVWSAADAFLGQGVTFVVGIVLARLLTPAEYGLIGICTIFITVLTSVVDSGFSSSLIRKKDVTDEDFNTMFITNLVVSVVLFVLLFICAPFVALFFGISELVDLVRVMGVILIIQALSITQNTILTKRLDFKKKTKASIISAITSGCIGIVMAYKGFGVWSLVGQQISKQSINTLCLWILNKWWPKLIFRKDSFLYMWGFGWKILLSALLNNIWNQLYQVVVGKFYNSATLGQYSRAKEYSNIFSLNLTLIIQRVTFPALAETQNELERMVAAYRKVIKLSMFATAICMISMAAVAEPLIYCMIGEQWYVAATFLPLICISQSLYPLHAINLNMLQIQGRSDIYLYLEIIKKVIALLPICVGVFVNIYWMLIGSIFVGVISFFLNAYYTGRDLGYSSWMQIRDVAPSYGIAFVIGLSVYFLKFLPFNCFYILLCQIIIGLIVFFALCYIFKLEEYNELKNIMVSLKNRKKNNKIESK